MGSRLSLGTQVRFECSKTRPGLSCWHIPAADVEQHVLSPGALPTSATTSGDLRGPADAATAAATGSSSTGIQAGLEVSRSDIPLSQGVLCQLLGAWHTLSDGAKDALLREVRKYLTDFLRYHVLCPAGLYGYSS